MSMVLINKRRRRAVASLETCTKCITVIGVDVLDCILVIKDFIPNGTAEAVDDGWCFIISEIDRKDAILYRMHIVSEILLFNTEEQKPYLYSIHLHFRLKYVV